MSVAIIGQTQINIDLDAVQRLAQDATITRPHRGPMQHQYHLARTITYPDTGELVDASLFIVTNVPSDADSYLADQMKRQKG